MDQGDEGQRLEEIARDQALARARAAAVARAAREPADNCDECGLQIPSARQLAVPGTRHCTHCAELIERGLL